MRALRRILRASNDPRHIIIGVSISICGNMVVSLALNTQRLAHLRLERSGKPYLRSWLWWLGICLMTIGETVCWCERLN